ncbi:MAG: M4 family metallopeptidase, partial [Flavobacterium sp.]
DVYVDAITGEILFYNATIKHLGEHSNGIGTTGSEVAPLAKNQSNMAVVAATAATRYSGSQSIETTLSGSSYILSDVIRGGGVQTYNCNRTGTLGTTNFTDADNNWTAAEFNNTNKDNGALDAHWGSEKVYDFWKNTFNRNSYNNAGAKLKSYVHVDLVAAGLSGDQNNAFWNGSAMVYGDGSTGVFDILTALDVTGHEIGHAVCQSTAALAYQRESGAMNEGFSDIWGACVEYQAAPNKATWLIGEDIERRSGHTALRNMSNPNEDGQPDTYNGTYWKNVNCGTPVQSNDYCGVHYNSGVLNHWFYILTIGKSGTNDIGSVFNVTGIGIDKAAQIAFRTESNYLTSNSTYANARTYGIQAATDLYGAGSAEVIATTNAFYAVGIGAAYTGPTDTTAPTAPASLAASGTTQTTTNLSWTASTDNVGVTGYNVYQGTTLKATVTTTSYAVTGLTASTAYTFSVKAKDAAGNVSAASNTVNVTTTASTGDTSAPTAPASLTASGTTQTTTNLSWTASADNVGVTGYNVYQGTTLKATVTTTSYAVTGLTAATAYTFSVKAKDAAGNISASSNVVNVTTSSTSITYCNSKGNSVSDEFIDYVAIGGISNVTGANGGYGNFTNLVGNLSYGANALTVSTGYSGTVYTEYWAIWIDFNKNGTFESTELVESGSAASSANLAGTVTVPTTALAGPTRMRVSMKYGSAPTACETFAYGEVEDYTVNIGGGSVSGVATTNQIGNEANNYDFNMYPNPVDNVLNVSLLDNRAASYKIYNLIGQEVKGGNLNQKEISVSDLGSGVYIFEINDGQKTITKKFIKK